jgi:predicted anti-sigma-YlaC factor YlaD
VSPLCPIVRESLADYLGERLPAPQRRILREHLAACAECRDTAAAQDASLVFARPFSAEDVASEESASILASVRTGVAHIEAERRIRAARPSRKRAARVAAAAAVALLALTIPAGSRRDARVASIPAALAVPTRVAPASSVGGAGLAEAALPEQAASPSEGATVYELNPGAGREEPRVVWIVDRGLDI